MPKQSRLNIKIKILFKRRPETPPSSLVLAAGKVARKVVLALALVAADVALERVFVAVAAHVDGVEDVVREVDVTVLAVVQSVRLLQWRRQARRRRAGPTVGDARGAGVPTVLTARPGAGAATAVRRRARFGRDGRGGGGVGYAGHRGRGRVWLLDSKGLLVLHGLRPRRHWGLRVGLGVGRETGQLACQGRQLVQRVVHDHIVATVILLRLVALGGSPTRPIVGFLPQVRQLM